MQSPNLGHRDSVDYSPCQCGICRDHDCDLHNGFLQAPSSSSTSQTMSKCSHKPKCRKECSKQHGRQSDLRRFLFTFTSVASGAVTACSIILAVATDHWLFTSEMITFTFRDQIDMNNMTEVIEMTHEVRVYIRSGLWRVCTIDLLNGR